MKTPWSGGLFPLKEIMDYVRRDKKVVDCKTIELVLVEEVGLPVLKKFDLEILEERLTSLGGEFC